MNTTAPKSPRKAPGLAPGAFFFLLLAGCAPRPAIHYESGVFRATGVDPEALSKPELLRVTVGESETPLFGEHRIEGDSIVFAPRYPLRPGLTYRAALRSSTLAVTLQEPAAGPAASVLRVLPGGDVLPENLLRFYVHFSAPMSRGEGQSRVRLLGPGGRVVDLPFLDLELWDPSGTRLTLFFDPGRIKRGLKPREDHGPVLEEGKSYELVVDAGWPDAAGRPLKAGFRKAFRAAAPDDRQPDPARWTLSAPRPGSREPLEVAFDEPLDEAMLHRMLSVAGVAGRVEVEEALWRFTPDAPWSAGRQELRVDTLLEDRAGNSVERPFEVDVFRPVGKTIEPKFRALPFDVKP